MVSRLCRKRSFATRPSGITVQRAPKPVADLRLESGAVGDAAGRQPSIVSLGPTAAAAALLLHRFDGDGQDTRAQLARVVPHTQLGRDEGLVNAQLQSDHVVGSKLGRRERSINHHRSGGVEG